MDEAFAQKLRWLLVSMMMLILDSVLAATAALLDRSCTASSDWRCFAAVAEALVLFPILIAIFATWHAFDLLQNCKPKGGFVSSIAGYPLLFCALLLLLPVHALITTGRFTADNFGISQPEPWLVASVYGLLLLLVLLTLSKGVFVAHSRLLKRS